MKFAFFKTKAAIIIIGLVSGMYIGFKIANLQYRREQGVTLTNAVAEASGGGSGQALAGVRAIIDKARNNQQDVDAQLDAAEQLFQINQPAEAIQFLDRAIKVDPKDARATAGMALANLMMEKPEEAIVWSKRSLEQSPNNPGVSFMLISAYIQLKRNLDEAERMIGKLEADGGTPAMISKLREDLAAARSGNSGGAGVKPGSKTMLDHGPSESKPAPSGGKPGGQ